MLSMPLYVQVQTDELGKHQVHRISLCGRQEGAQLGTRHGRPQLSLCAVYRFRKRKIGNCGRMFMFISYVGRGETREEMRVCNLGARLRPEPQIGSHR